MKPSLVILIIILMSNSLYGQSSYVGIIGNYPIELVTDIYSDGVANAVYVYSKFDQPIRLQGKLQQTTLTLFEIGKGNKKQSSLIFQKFDTKSNQLEGEWTDLKTQKHLAISLTKQFDFDSDEESEWEEKEIIQSAALEKNYVKLLIRKMKGEFTPRVTGINIYEKKTDKLLQTIPMDCQLLGLNNTSIGDFNFDGLKDFSVFESSYAGSNTSSLYFLYNPKTKLYNKSSFTGTSLEFNSKTKRILERNSCCAGSQLTTSIYKVVNNKMVLVESHCYKWDEKKNKLVERKIKDCE